MSIFDSNREDARHFSPAETARQDDRARARSRYTMSQAQWERGPSAFLWRSLTTQIVAALFIVGLVAAAIMI